MAIGEATAPALVSDALARARQRALLVPDLLVDARRVANTVLAGWHGRRRRGIGENFWQFRPYVEGESQVRIDWRRSARDDHTYIRDREWEAAHTVWLWADFSPSMLYKSKGALVSKQSRAIVLILAMAELLSRGGERIGWPGLTEPFASHNGAERLAARIANAPENVERPDLTTIRRNCDVILAGDFLDAPEETIAWLQVLSRHSVRAHLVEIADPAEESFPYNGRTEFVDPEDGARLTLGRAETLLEDYRNLYLARRQTLAEFCRRLGWSYRVHHTDRPASEALMHLHLALADGGDGAR
ncbi:DUF58 domain-containing protein [Limoniibacter endophyticus]|uniref:DUF58 domain-containing protein n=1 Tax=Limoniibacter endophyticus TaxID=1565040 RepID=A0A8J3GGK5_9HYPH|nr:DUF58 domain-containing protein [Limoniibacter endophyticus]GHC65519.1 hypothetical protein GCM10010136_08260 [Limoniibacter endophyticus]